MLNGMDFPFCVLMWIFYNIEQNGTSILWGQMDFPLVVQKMEIPFNTQLRKFHFLKDGLSIFSEIVESPFLQQMENPLL